MSFDTTAYLRKATSRAKSDVANKMVGMFLHEVSRRLTSDIGIRVSDSVYCDAVVKLFGHNCAYCNTLLERDRAAVEHLDGMNRFRVGLHVPGNVIVACNRCNRAKRGDDSLPKLILAETGWESFLSHDSSRCLGTCKTCAYWRTVWAASNQCVENMASARAKIAAFRASYPEALDWSRRARLVLHSRMEAIYRDCQEFASVRIKQAVEGVFQELVRP